RGLIDDEPRERPLHAGLRRGVVGAAEVNRRGEEALEARIPSFGAERERGKGRCEAERGDDALPEEQRDGRDADEERDGADGRGEADDEIEEPGDEDGAERAGGEVARALGEERRTRARPRSLEPADGGSEPGGGVVHAGFR